MLSEKNFDIDNRQSDQARSYYFQLLNDVAYNFGKINKKLNFNEHTLVDNYKIDSFNVDRLDRALISFLKRNPLEKKFNL